MGAAFGNCLRRRARALGLSDVEVARRLGMSQQRYGHYVTGLREPDLDALARICRALGLTPDEALGFDEARTGEEEDEAENLHRRAGAALGAMDLPTLRTAVALLDVLATRPHEAGEADATPAKARRPRARRTTT